MRMSWLATATNAETLPIRSPSSVASASRYAPASAPSGTVSTSSFCDSMSASSRPERPVEGRQAHEGRGLRPAALPEDDRGRAVRPSPACRRSARSRVGLVGPLERRAGARIARLRLVADELDRPRRSSRPRRPSRPTARRGRGSGRGPGRSPAAGERCGRPTSPQASPSDHATRGQSPTPGPLPASWSSPARSTSSRSRRRPAGGRRRRGRGAGRRPASRRRRRAGRGVSQVASAARSAGDTLARTCARNWRTLEAHQEVEERIDHRTEKDAERTGKDDHEQDERPVLHRVPGRRCSASSGRGPRAGSASRRAAGSGSG